MNASSRRDFFKKAITAGAAFAPLSMTFGHGYETAIDRTPKASLSEKPGIGVEINEEGMKKYATPGMPFFE